MSLPATWESESPEYTYKKGRKRVIRAVICDDEAATVNIIRYYIESKNFPLEIIGTAENGRDALALIQKTKPNLVFNGYPYAVYGRIPGNTEYRKL